MRAITPLLLLSLLFIAPVHAAGKAESCRADAQKLCPGIKPGGGAILSCLKQHEKELTPACSEHMREAGRNMKAASKSCAADMKTHCSGVKRGGGRIHACLKEHEASLSADCKKHMQSSGN